MIEMQHQRSPQPPPQTRLLKIANALPDWRFPHQLTEKNRCCFFSQVQTLSAIKKPTFATSCSSLEGLFQ